MHSDEGKEQYSHLVLESNYTISSRQTLNWRKDSKLNIIHRHYKKTNKSETHLNILIPAFPQARTVVSGQMQGCEYQQIEGNKASDAN